jgi:hypothetical protein
MAAPVDERERGAAGPPLEELGGVVDALLPAGPVPPGGALSRAGREEQRRQRDQQGDPRPHRRIFAPMAERR